ncbi:MAG TPA: condensation domain-containing protein, partial [Terracidiphilus sp.]|nr:condensation domain-containing protein [Terracidiphilus sp.]
SESTRRDIPGLASVFNDNQVNRIFIPSLALQQLAEGYCAAKLFSTDLLKVVSGSEQLQTTQSIVKMFCELPQCSLHNEYGPSETHVVISHDLDRAPVSWPKHPPIGRPISNTQIYLLDGQLQPVPIGVVGELYIGGEGLARGYVNRPDLTAEKFIPDLYSKQPGGRLYQTGDLARYQADGTIEFLGRIDNQLKIRGFRIEPGEIESVLSEHPAVRESIIMASEDRPGARRLIAYAVPHDMNSAPSTSALRNYLKDSLPEYMIPSAFVLLETFPLNANGKVDRKKLGTPDSSRPALDANFVAPRTPKEQLLATIWSQVLGIKQVGVHDNFFELGGDSIVAIQVIARANQAGLWLALKQLFQYQTVAELAAVANTAPVIQSEQGAVIGELPLSPIQHWFFEQNLPEPHHWNQAMLLESREPLDKSLLESALNEMLTQHDALRLRFSRDGDGWSQIDAPPGETISCRYVDLSSLPQAKRQAAFETAATETQASLNITDGPLLGATLFEMGDGLSQRLLIVINHLAVDGVSWRILLEDLQTAYEQRRSSTEIRLPPKTTSFKYWAERLSNHAVSEMVQQELIFWTDSSRLRATPLPVDQLAEKEFNTEASAKHLTLALSKDETQLLLQRVPKAARVQINDVLLTALAATFQEWTGVNSLLVDVEGHGREAIFDDVDLSRTVGWFTSISPVYLETEDAADLIGSLRLIREQIRRIPHHGIGYGLLRYLDGKETSARLQAMPQAEVSFNYLGQFDQIFGEGSQFKLLIEPSGPFNSPRGTRRYLLNVTGLIVGGQLQINWTYSENFHRQETCAYLAQRYLEILRTLIQDCLSLPQPAESATETQEPVEQAASADHGMQLPSVRPAPQHRYEPFPLTDIQQAYWFGRSGAFELGKVSCHIYTEIELAEKEFNLDRFALAWLKLIERHEMLRAVVLPDGRQQILEHVPPYRIEVLDLRGEEPATAAAQLEAVRERMSHRILPSEKWPLFEIRVSCYEERLRIHFDLDLLIGDAWSWQLLLRELLTLYQAPETSFDPLELSFRDYVLTLDDVKDSALYRRSWEYWQGRLPTMPPAPEFPLVKVPSSHTQHRFTRRSAHLPAEQWRELKAQATRKGLTASGLLLAVYAEVLARWSKNPRFTINLPLFNRLPLHPQVNEIVGDFTTITLLAVDNLSHDSFEARARRLQEQLWEDLEYRWVGGVKVLRELIRSHGSVHKAAMPVVFTSLVYQDIQTQFESLKAPLGEIVYGISQTPQVWIDLQVTEENLALSINWDAVEELFPSGMLDEMFAAYCGALQQLSEAEEAWAGDE